MSTYHYRRPTLLHPHPYLCGAKLGAGTTTIERVTCGDCTDLLDKGVGTPTPRLTKPPEMNDNDTGEFVFYDVDYDERVNPRLTMEVVPQTTGNVEIEIDGALFTLSHLDRADLIRALLHDFHYSPERGGPNDES